MKHILKIYYLRNVFIISILIAIGLIVCNFYFIFPSFNELLIKDIETEAVHLTRHISSMITTDLTALSRDSISAEMLKAINQLKEEFEFLKLNIFSRSGVTIFSTESEMIGTINKNDYFHRILSKGQTFSQVAVISARSLEIEVLSVDVVETRRYDQNERHVEADAQDDAGYVRHVGEQDQADRGDVHHGGELANK